MSKQKMLQEIILAHSGHKLSLSTIQSIEEDLHNLFIEEIQSEKGLSLKGIGKIYLAVSPKREVRNPATGKTMMKPENLRVAFKASQKLKDLVNNK